MENFNTVPDKGTFGGSVEVVNQNFLLAQQEMEVLQNKCENESARAIDAENSLRQLYNNLQQSQPIPVTALPATGEAGKIYRLAGTNSYADYMYSESDLTTPIKMAEYNNAIDASVNPASNNIVSNKAIANKIGLTHSGSIVGAGSTWAIQTNSTPLPLDTDILIRFPHKVTCAAPDNAVFLMILFLDAQNQEIGRPYENNSSRNTELPEYLVFHTPNVESYINFEGRWLSSETLDYEIYVGNAAANLQSALGNRLNYTITGHGEKWISLYITVPDYTKPSKIVFKNTVQQATLFRPYIIYLNDASGNPYISGGPCSYLYKGTVEYIPACNTIVFQTRIVEGAEFSLDVIQFNDEDYLKDATESKIMPSNNPISSGAVAGDLGIAARGSLRGNDENFAYVVPLQNIPPNTDLVVRIPNYKDITFGGTGGLVRFRIFTDIQGGGSEEDAVNLKSYDNWVFNGAVHFKTQNAVTYLQIEGRWSSTQLLEYEVLEGNAASFFNTVAAYTTPIELAGMGTTWLVQNIVTSNPNVGSRIVFKNTAHNASASVGGTAYLIYVDYELRVHGPKGQHLYKDTEIEIPAGKVVRFETRIEEGETLQFDFIQNTTPAQRTSEAIAKVTNVIGRNTYKDSAIRSFGIGYSGIKPFGFVHISDTHTQKDIRYKCLENARILMEYYRNLTCCIITGDIVYDTFADPMTYYDRALNGTDTMFLNVIGNHDAGQPNEGVGWENSQGTDIQVYNKFIAPYKDSWNLGDGDTGKNYYYKDFYDEKVRMIVLYDYETEQIYNGETLPGGEVDRTHWRENCAVRQAQVDWLISTLINTPDDYGVIIAHHESYSMEDSTNNPFSTKSLNGVVMDTDYHYCSDPHWLDKILSAFKNRTQLNISWEQTGGVITNLHAVADFRNVASEFVCILAGHTHDDFIGHPVGYPELTQIIVGADNLHYGGSSCPRAYDSPSEDLINVVNVDRDSKTITIIRVGSDYSIYGQKRDIVTINY